MNTLDLSLLKIPNVYLPRVERLESDRPREENSLLGAKINSVSWDVDNWVRIGRLHHYLGEYSEAVDCYDHVLKINSNLGKVWYYKGQALRLARSDDARYCFDKAKKLGFNINSLKKKN